MALSFQRWRFQAFADESADDDGCVGEGDKRVDDDGAARGADDVAAGIVGDIGGHMLNADGYVVETDLSRRMLRLDEARLRAIPTVIAVAVGKQKADVIHAAPSSGIVDVIITDDDTMAEVLRYGRPEMNCRRTSKTRA